MRTTTLLVAWLCIFATTTIPTTTAQLVGPGAMRPYGGGAGGGRRSGGYVRVQEPAKGFFIAGSAVRDMNGLYGKVEMVPHGISHKLQLAYKHDQTNWIMALTAGDDSEWLLLDAECRDRFRHNGNTIIPGSGQRWSHLHRAKPEGGGGGGGGGTTPPPPPRDQEDMDAALIHGGDDIAELPWQMIAILDESMLQKLRRYSKHHHHTVQRALGGSSLPSTGGGFEHGPPQDMSPPTGLADADDVCLNEGELKTSMSLYGAALDRVSGTSQVSTWSRALLLVRRSACWRRTGRNLTSALLDVEEALSLYPSYTEGLFEKGMVLFNVGGRAMDTLQTWLQLLKLDREYPKLDEWIVRTVAQDQRTKTAAKKMMVHAQLSEGSNAECVAWRQTSGCDATGIREEDLDKSCREHISNHVSGYCECVVPSSSKVHPTISSSSKVKAVYLELVKGLMRAGEQSCTGTGTTLTCTEHCRLRWKSTMAKAAEHEEGLRSEGQTSLQDVHRT